MVAAFHSALARTAGAGTSSGRWGSMRWSDRALWSVGIRMCCCRTRSAARAAAVSQLQLWCALSWVQPPASPPPRPVAQRAATAPLMHHLPRLHHPFTHCVQTAGEVEVFPERMEVKLSMILKWYGRDFGSKADLLRFLVQHLPPGEGALGGGRVRGLGGRVGLRWVLRCSLDVPCFCRSANPMPGVTCFATVAVLAWAQAGACRGRFPAQTHNLPANVRACPDPRAEPKQQLEGMLAQAQDVERDILFTYRPYDWGTNSK